MVKIKSSKIVFYVGAVLVIVLSVVLRIQWTNRAECHFQNQNRLDNSRTSLFGERALNFIQYLFVKNVVGKEIIRVGSYDDGGYSMLDDFSNISAAYGVGVGNNWSWDLDLASRGIDVLMFDPSINKPNLNNSHLKFYPIGLSSDNGLKKNYMNLEELLKLDNNLNKKNLILKMDIEGSEWEVLYKLRPSVLEKFSQIVIEFHWLDEILTSTERYNMGISVMEKLNKTHQLIWIHGNNLHPLQLFGSVPIPVVFEVTYVKREEKIKFTNEGKRKKIDERSFKSFSEIFLWWLEDAKGINISNVFFYNN